MARRKRKDDEFTWSPPEFDEVGYMRQEIENAKIAVVVIAWAVVGAVIAYALAVSVHPVLGYLVGLLAFGVLYFLLPILGLPIHGFKRKDWISHASIYFFSWLAFSIVLLNPPFSDHTAPVVSFVAAGAYTPTTSQPLPMPGSLNCVPLSASTVHVPPGKNTTLYVLFRATDNVGVARIQVQVNNANATYAAVGSEASVCKDSAGTTFPPGTYAVQIPMSTATFTVAVTAGDAAGLGAAASVNIQTP